MAVIFQRFLLRKGFFLITTVSLTLLMIHVLHTHENISTFLNRPFRYSLRAVKKIEKDENSEVAKRKSLGVVNEIKTTELTFLTSSSPIVETIENKTNPGGINTLGMITTELPVHKSSSPLQRRQKNIACVIPELNPLDPEIIKYIGQGKVEECPIRNLARIEGDNLVLKADNINDAGYRYIQRVNDFNVKLSSWNSLVKFQKKKINEGKSYIYILDK